MSKRANPQFSITTESAMSQGFKKISDQQVLGERGAALVDERSHAMGFLFKRYGAPEAGIDGLIELRDPTTGRVGGRLIAVQVKTRENRPYTAETEASFEYMCEHCTGQNHS